MKYAFGLAFLSLVCLPEAHADPACGIVEFRFKPAASDLQFVAWIEDQSGKVVGTPYITRLIGQFGLGNRPGAALLKTNFKWPYGRREMVFPVWAHRRDHHYPRVVMGGACGNSPQSRCPSGQLCAGDCEDSTIAYHSLVSSYEPFYCSPSGPSGMDVMSCASKGTFSKGAYQGNGAFSLYPPRADLTQRNSSVDSADILDFANQNDLVAVSAATPPANDLVSPPVYWYPYGVGEGDYVAWLEVSQESDFNSSHNHPNQADSVATWDFEGHKFLGQPSVLYRVPFHYGGAAASEIATQYAGYSTWDGSDGVLHPPDGTITTNKPASGAGRLLDVNDGVDVFRVKVVTGDCHGPLPDGGIMPGDVDGGMISDGGTTVVPGCTPPEPVTDLTLTPTQTGISVSFKAPQVGAAASQFDIRYREDSAPIPGAKFDQQLSAPSVAFTSSGAVMSSEIKGLMRQTSYAVAVRAKAPCGSGSAVVSQVTSTLVPKFVTLSGCFIATAAYGSPMEAHVDALRKFRDHRLLNNPAGRLLVATYYAFSPSLARAISADDNLRALARAALAPIVALVTR